MAEQGEVYRVNKLIEIEHLDWTKQLEKAVCVFSFFCPHTPVLCQFPVFYILDH